MPLQLSRIQIVQLCAPIDEPVRTSFGVMTARPGLWIMLEDQDGLTGFGEIWCNFPSTAAAARFDLARRVIGPWLLDQSARGQLSDDPAGFLDHAQRTFRILAIQSGEHGPIANILSGMDCALHDLAARRADMPLANYLGGNVERPLLAYASGINPAKSMARMDEARTAGFTAFKLKIGFEQDRRNLDAMSRALIKGELLMADANQAFALDEVSGLFAMLEDFPLTWIEEPIAADHDVEDFKELSNTSAIPLAGGENVTDLEVWDRLIAQRVLGFVQPDCAKWGGISRNLAIARKALERDLAYCPHFLGGGIGLLHSAHLLAAAGGPGLLEIDCNPNPLRSDLLPALLPGQDGKVRLTEEAGIGVLPDMDASAQWIEKQVELRP